MAGRTSARKKPAQNKVPCKNPGICTSRKNGNHIVGTFTQHKCDEIAKRRAAGEDITAESAVDVRPVGMPKVTGEADKVRSEMDSLREVANAWKDTPEAALGFVRWSQQFTDYSPFNRMMIHLQNPDATQVAARGKWDKLGREVPEDAASVSIFVPGSKGQFGKKDKEGKPVLDENGKQVMVRSFVNRFKEVPVYDIADTTGDTPPEIETHVISEDALRGLVNDFETDYFLNASGTIMSADTPARINSEGRVEYNTSTADSEQQLVNRLVAVGMAISMHVRETDLDGREDKKPWDDQDHMYAGVAAAWNMGKDAGVDLTDLAVDKMAHHAGTQPASTLAMHATKVSDHIRLVREGAPLAIADALA